ncbi:GNAT family N-acetyltransferase [Bacillus shivajii]|uniref:GNAT family N-acetyltransferase n=1 Tax=Bacillus shivajii TaxID=1983719 RepID=UPI001CFAAA9F|nr:GNAT family N-acetyltransferase [Bacillus shivajii]UCZ51573.1 GNAT family N-acetyltransferase [Bacillus shivajii]
MKLTSEVKIVKYKPELAEAVAHMWNESRDGWGGHADVKTSDHVQSQEGNSTNLCTYIAMVGDEAVGYCGLSEYREDKGALYIPLLNVRPDYHGKKIGKKLLLRALEETINRKWPRLDLYTWPGNTKAVPLYKKCGFFWENRDDSVHLMNFLPTVLTQPAFQHFFEKADWYKDSQREILVEPDGETRNGFDFYHYYWEKDGQNLKVTFEKSGRGICEIETNDYSVKLEVDQHQNVFGKSYPVYVKVRNKTSEQMAVNVSPLSNEQIDIDLPSQKVIADCANMEGSFFIHSTEEKQDSKRTHPTVGAAVTINGEVIPLQLGILPKEPVSINSYVNGRMSFDKATETVFLKLENHFDTNINVSLQLPDHDCIHFHGASLDTDLQAKEKKTISFSADVLSACFYSEKITVKVVTEEGESVDFKTHIALPFNTLSANIYGECPDYYHLFNGVTHVAMKKVNNQLLYERGRKNESDHLFFYPKLGKPFSEEFSMKKPNNVHFFIDGQTVGMKVSYSSRDFPNITLHRVIELSSEGLMSQHYLIENRGEEMVEELHVNLPLTYSLANTYLPYAGKTIFNEGTYYHEVNAWDENKLSENWLFTKEKEYNAVLIWEGNSRLHFHTWHMMYFDETWENIDSGSVVSTSKIFFGLNVFSTIQEVKEFSLKKQVIEKPTVALPLPFQPKDGYPFVSEDTVITFSPFVNQSAETSLQITDDKEETIATFEKSESETWHSWETNISVDSNGVRRIQRYRLSGMLSSQVVEKDLLVFPVQIDGEVRKGIVVEQGEEVYTLDNGYISVKGSPAFYPSFYSLKVGGTEWLDSSFPTPSAKSWWNPWIGGINYSLRQLLQRTIIDSSSTCQFVKLTDSHGEVWDGLKMSTVIKDHALYDGIVFHQYVATRAGIPVLATFTEVEQNIGYDFHGTTQTSMFNLYTGNKRGDITAYVNGKNEEAFVHHHHEAHHFGLDYATFTQKGSQEKLHFIPNNELDNLEVYMNREVVCIGMQQPLYVKNGRSTMTSPHFFLFSENMHQLDELEVLRTIRFYRSE